MSQQENQQSPFQKLSAEEKAEILNAKVYIGRDLVKICEIDELEISYDVELFKNSLTQQQIYDIQAGVILRFDPNDLFETSSFGQYTSDDYDEDAGISSYRNQQNFITPRYDHLFPRSNQSCSTSRNPFESLTPHNQERVRNSVVQVPGFQVKLCDFIGSLEEEKPNAEDLYKLLTQDEIDKILKGETFTLFSHLVDSLDKFIKKSTNTYDQNSSGGGINYLPNNANQNNKRNSNDQDNLPSNKRNSNGNNRNGNNSQVESMIAEENNQVPVYFGDLNEFYENLLTQSTINLVKPSPNDQSLYYTYLYWRSKNRPFNSSQQLYFYCDLQETYFVDVLRTICNVNINSIVDQICYLYYGHLSMFENALLRLKFSKGTIFFIMDNVECLCATDICMENKFFDIMKEIKYNHQGIQIERNKLLIVTDINHASYRELQLETFTYSIERRECNDDNYNDLINLKYTETAQNQNTKYIALSLQIFRP